LASFYKQAAVLARAEALASPASRGTRRDFARAEALARQAVELDVPARATLGWILQFKDNPVAGVTEFERVFTVNPHYADSRYASMLIHAGRAADGIAYLEKIMRVDPFYPPIYPYLMGKGFFFLGSYEEAIERGRSAAVRMPGFRPGIVIRAAAAAYLGRQDEAQSALADLRKQEPKFTIADALRLIILAKQEDADRLAEGLRLAGLPKE
jgi:adenylate cyclase